MGNVGQKQHGKRVQDKHIDGRSPLNPFCLCKGRLRGECYPWSSIFLPFELFDGGQYGMPALEFFHISKQR